MRVQWTAQDNGHVNEIISHLSSVEEIDWLKGLQEKCTESYKSGYKNAIKDVFHVLLEELDDSEREEILEELNQEEE